LEEINEFEDFVGFLRYGLDDRCPRDACRTEETAGIGRVTRKKMWWVEKGENDY
jgi:hypothetical protein